MNEEQLQSEQLIQAGDFVGGIPSVNTTGTWTAPAQWAWQVGPNTIAGGHDDEVAIREKAVEYAIQASGDKDLNLKEFSNLLDFFYTYLKTGEKLNF